MASKSRAPNYTPERAACILAEAELFGDAQTCSKWAIGRVTLWGYKKRLETDKDLEQLLTLKRRMLALGWQDQACKALNVALNELTRRIPIAKTEDDGKLITCIANACKIVGELKITGEALDSGAPAIGPATFSPAIPQRT